MDAADLRLPAVGFRPLIDLSRNRKSYNCLGRPAVPIKHIHRKVSVFVNLRSSTDGFFDMNAISNSSNYFRGLSVDVRNLC
jgi:hypothetical protein